MNSRSTKRLVVALTGLALGALALAGCAGSGADAAASSKDSLISQADCSRNAAAPITYISGYGYSASAGQLDVFMAKELGYFKDLCLNVNINASGANGQQLVSSGKAQFTELGSAEDVLMAAANSKNIKAIATFGTTSPFCIFANKSIKSLKDLEGQKLGYFINLTPVANQMLEAAGADVSKIDLIKMTNYDPTVVVRNQVQAVVGYASSQCATLKAQGAEFTSFTPAQFGLTGTYNVMEVNAQFLQKNRAVVSDFMRADLKALKYCLDNEADCVKRISALAAKNGQGQAFPPAQEERTWKVESQFVRDSKAGAPGVQDLAEWEGAAKTVKKYGTVKDIPPVQDVIDLKLVKDLYSGSGSLIWPGDGK